MFDIALQGSSEKSLSNRPNFADYVTMMPLSPVTAGLYGNMLRNFSELTAAKNYWTSCFICTIKKQQSNVFSVPLLELASKYNRHNTLSY